MTIKLLALGATGYIGGAALHGIYNDDPALFDVSALVRSEKDDAAVSTAFGDARIVRGDFSKLDLIREEASRADFVLNCADADNHDVVKAILSGIKERHAKTGKKAIYLHTSGTSVVAQGKTGEYVKEADKVINDASEDDIKNIPRSALHREVDLSIFEADTEGYVDAFIIAPSCIYAKGSGPVRTRSAQIPTLIRVAVARGGVVIPGLGTAVWNEVHVDDLEDLYTRVAKLALSGKDTSSSWGRFYFASVEERPWIQVAEKLAQLLYVRGKVTSKEIDHITPEEVAKLAKDYPYLPSTATNSRSKSERGIALGWKPRKEGLWDEIEDDVQAVLAGEL